MLRDGLKALRFTRAVMGKRMVHLNLQLLYDCNFTCKICDFWKEPYRNLPRLGAREVREIAAKLKSHAPLIVSLGGGEPFLHEELAEIVGILAEDHFPVLICNGWFVTPENAGALFKAGLYEASISVDYADPEKHDAQRGRRGAFERAMEGLRILHENRVHPSQRVHMISVVMDDNVDDVEPLIRMARDIGITYLITFYSACRGRKEKRTSPADVSTRLLEWKRKYPEFVSLPGFLRRYGEAPSGGGIKPCYAGKNLFNIDCRGNVTRCIDRLDAPVGNILAEDAGTLLARLEERCASDDCGDCWTSCRGSVETLLYGEKRLANLAAYYRMIRPVPLAQSRAETP